MRLQLCAMTTAASAFAFAGACFAELVKTDWDRSAHFGQYRNIFMGKGKDARSAHGGPNQVGRKCHPGL
jgi:hypothetical protein